jgi:4-oxalocrotonate tautomerase
MCRSAGVGERTGIDPGHGNCFPAAKRFPRRQQMLYHAGGQSQEGLMPEVVFYALGGRSIDQKRALIKDFTDAVVKNYKVDPSAVTITIVESAKEDKAKGGVLFSDMAAAKT